MSEQFTRRDFLKLAGLGAATTAVLWGCGPGAGDALEGNGQVVYEAELLEMLGPEWKQRIAEQVATSISQPIGESDPQTSIAHALVGAAITGESVLQSKLMDNVKIELLSDGDIGLSGILSDLARNNGKIIKFYYEPTRGGFVVHAPKENAWYKFFGAPENTALRGYQNQAIDVWRKLLALEGVPGDVAIGETVINGVTHLYHKTPNVGTQNLAQMIEGSYWGTPEATAEQSKRLVMQWFERQIGFIRDGNYAVVHYDPNPGNLRYLDDAGKFVSIDFDTVPMAFDSTDTAAKVLAQRVKERLTGGPLPYTLTDAELSEVITRVIGRDIGPLNKIQHSIVKLNNVPLADGGTFGIRYYYAPETVKGISSKDLVKRLNTTLENVTDVVPTTITETFQFATETRVVQMNMNASASSLTQVANKNIKLAQFIEAAKPWVVTGARLLDILSIVMVQSELNEMSQQPTFRPDRVPEIALTFGELRIGAVLSALKNQFNGYYEALAQDITLRDDARGACTMMPVLAEAVEEAVQLIGVDPMIPPPDSYMYDAGRWPEHALHDVIQNSMADILKQSGVWVPLVIDRGDAIFGRDPLKNNLFIRSTQISEGAWEIVFAGSDDDNQMGGDVELTPVFSVMMYQSDTGDMSTGEVSILDPNKAIWVNFGTVEGTDAPYQYVFFADPAKIQYGEQQAISLFQDGSKLNSQDLFQLIFTGIAQAQQ